MTTSQRTQFEGQETLLHQKSVVKAYNLRLPIPTISDLKSDSKRLLQALNQQHKINCKRIDIEVLRILSPRLRLWNWQCQIAVRENEIIALSKQQTHTLGLALDIGTSKVAGYLVNLSSGQTLITMGIMNPQVKYGEDIITRITAAIDSPCKRTELENLITKALNEIAIEMCDKVGSRTEEIVDAVLVGNTAMHHLALQLPVDQLATSPFLPVISTALDVKARVIGLHLAPGASVHILPNIAGFVGADHVAMLLATEGKRTKKPVLALDIGTNTEVSLINNGKITTVSCASGPAFEGGHIKYGMRASSGAIERVRISNDDIQYQTIDNKPAVGICGSGVLDAIAQLYLTGIIDESGKICSCHSRLRTTNNQKEFVLAYEREQGRYPTIVITQQDIREVQLAKAAIRAGIQIILETNNLPDDEIDQIIIAGAFGNYIDISSAITIGMLPPLPLERFLQVGNAAGMGAKLALLSSSKRAKARKIASQVQYIELATSPHFNSTFVEAIHLGQYYIENNKRRKIE